MRLPAEQTSPWLINTPKSAPSIAASKSASAKKIFGDFPPSSSVTRFTVSAACLTMVLPTAALPVNAILLTSGCCTSGAPQLSPKPVMIFTTPGGNPTSVSQVAISSAVRGVLPDLLSQPEQRAPALLRRGRSPRPIFESRLRGSNSAVHVVGVGIRNLRDHFLRCGIVDRKCLARLAFNPLAVDVHLVCTHFCLYPCWHGDLHQLAELRSAGHYVILLTCTGETPAPTSLVVDLRRP